MWAVKDIVFEMVDDMTDDPVVTVLVTTPGGYVSFAAEPIVVGATLLLRGVHVQDGGRNAIGAANLMVIAQAMLEGLDLDGLDIEGALRTTGASPGRRPGILRFTRRVRLAPARDADPAQDD